MCSSLIKVYPGLQVKSWLRGFNTIICSIMLHLIKLGTDGDDGILPVVSVTDDMVEHTGFVLNAIHGVTIANCSALDLLALLLISASTFSLGLLSVS